MKKFFAIIIFIGLSFFGYAQEDLSVNNYWKFNGDMTNALYEHILSHAFTQINERSVLVGGLKTKNDWENRQAEIRKVMEDIVGEFPAKTPLNPVITGTIKRDGFVVEKIYFESRPGYYVTAALFRPTTKSGKLPAIIYCCGHSNNGFRNEAYQRVSINLVKKGFIVLAFDPVGQGERIQYFDANGTSIFSPTREHSYPGTQSFLSGRTPANYFIWDGIRAVDYLLTRKEVDPERIGITGRSGGGTQSAYIAAMDDRILAAAPECYITTFDKLLRSQGPQDAEQIFKYSLKRGFDHHDLIALRAPRPTLMVTTTMDMFSIQGARDVYIEAKKIFSAFGVPDNLMMVEDDAVHASTKNNREATYAFFRKFLNNPGDTQDEPVEFFEEKDLWVTHTGQVQSSLKGETLFSLNEKFTDEVLAKMQVEKQKNPDFYRDITRKAKLLTGYCEPVLPKEVIFSGRMWRDNYAIEKYIVKGTGDYYIPVLRLSTGIHTGKVVLWLDEQGKAPVAEKGGIAEKLVKIGYDLVIPDLNGFGELSGQFRGGDAIMMSVPLNIWYAGILTHKFPLAISVEEIKILVDFIKGLGTSGTLTGIACGTLTSDLLHAVVINREFNQIALINPLLSYQSIVQERDYHAKFVMSAPAGVIGAYDIPDLITALSPLKICMINPVNSLEQAVDSPIFEQTYRDFDKLKNLSVIFKAPDVFLPLAQWLE